VKYAVEMGSGAMICIPSFIKTGSGILKLMGGGEFTDTQAHRQHGDLISIHLIFRNEESRLRTNILPGGCFKFWTVYINACRKL
jgi:hypothetical protein